MHACTATTTHCRQPHCRHPPTHTHTHILLQAAYHDWLAASGLLTPTEAALLEWARQPRPGARVRARFARGGGGGGKSGTGGGAEAYRRATALEALFGFLHLEDPPRLLEVAEALLASGAAGAEAFSSVESSGSDADDGDGDGSASDGPP